MKKRFYQSSKSTNAILHHLYSNMIVYQLKKFNKI